MTVLTDGFVPARETLSQFENMRSGDKRGSLNDHAPDLKDIRGTHEPQERAPITETEPHGMYWTRDAQNNLRLRPHDWYVRYIAVQADEIFQLTRDAIGNDPAIIIAYKKLGRTLNAYIARRARINEMVATRKMRQELDDAAYQLCQAAKYKVDAEQKAQFIIERDGDIFDNEQINQLVERADQAAHEGFILAYAIYSAGHTDRMNFETSSRRVLEYSCRKLTEWFAQRRKNTETQRSASNSAAMALISNMFHKRRI